MIFYKKKKSSSISQKLPDYVTPGLRDFSFILCNIFVYEPILIKFSLIANIMKMQIFHEIHYLINFKSSAIYFCLTPNIFTTFQEIQHYEYANFSLNEV